LLSLYALEGVTALRWGSWALAHFQQAMVTVAGYSVFRPMLVFSTPDLLLAALVTVVLIQLLEGQEKTALLPACFALTIKLFTLPLLLVPDRRYPSDRKRHPVA
jgi:hypothetical protein